ncbi:dihydrodipicolinate reductase [Yoonia sp. SS1-5]|uniref:Dihydrodipicolinate reductase n=1 Tax=Yoonia rhodophyticola TaxID=3137370 RepID=A0AAN0MC92_9RHOB
MKRFIAALSIVIAAAPAGADAYEAIKDEATFVSLVDGKLLRNRLYGVRLNVLDNGQIEGSAIGWDITGTWDWQDGYFCREMSWGGDPIPYNCQLVEFDGANLRFTVDQGAGDSASFSIN